eukprot:TRINITY_DN3647_c0_g2_i2.p1 TRINITY_DN3647_c0_g2~~TRINITY_DN3647_c0_g2_i2.p1  ORF type:complete len:159 (-),score=37.25 TRINITY_DN3647_c0_g2_i2:10-486(-)
MCIRDRSSLVQQVSPSSLQFFLLLLQQFPQSLFLLLQALLFFPPLLLFFSWLLLFPSFLFQSFAFLHQIVPVVQRSVLEQFFGLDLNDEFANLLTCVGEKISFSPQKTEETLEESINSLCLLNQCHKQSIKSFLFHICLLYTSPSPRDLSTSRMPSSA